MNKRFLKRIVRHVSTRSRRGSIAAFCIALLLVVVFAGSYHSAFVSPEVHFADADASGMQIVPASCPSNPGDADAPYGCSGPSPLCPDGSIAPNGAVSQCPSTPPGCQGGLGINNTCAPAPTCSAFFIPSTVAPAEPSTFYWSSTNASYVNTSVWGGNLPPSGAIPGAESGQSFTVAVAAYGSGGDGTCYATLTVSSTPPSTCADGSAAPNGNASQCTCLQGNLLACVIGNPPGGPGNPGSGFCPDGSAAPDGNSTECTCAHGNLAQCTAGLCPDGTSAPNGNANQCTCAQGNLAACSGHPQCTVGAACTSGVNECSEYNTGVYLADCSCSATTPPDSQCVSGIRVLQALLVTPKLVQGNETTHVSWDIENAASCTVTASNGDGTGSNSTGVWTGLTGAEVSSPIVQQTIYTLHCLPLPGAVNPDGTPAQPLTETATVNIVPGFHEN